MSTYTYSIATDTANALVNANDLIEEITQSTISKTVNQINTNGDDLDIIFSSSITSQEETTLDAVVAAHEGNPPTEATPLEIDSDGRQIIRTASTNKGWHYQAHSVQFEVNKLNSIYNKDVEGNDLGYTTMKIYDDNGNECTTQGSADVDGVKTVVKWDPDFDFEIISGNIRQASKESVDSYVYVRAMVATGLPSPNDWLPVNFTNGGINLRYIGADENLKTDGRSSKYVKGSNGDYFEIIINYEADLLTNENRHEMSLMFEIYKDSTT